MMSVQIRPRDKFAIGAVLAILSLAAWTNAIHQSQAMAANDPMPDKMEPTFLPLQFLLFLSTWVVMMTAMMLPTAAPMVMTFAAVSRQRRSRHLVGVPTALFTLGYLLAWGSSGLLAYVVSALSPMITRVAPELTKNSGLIGGSVLIMAGLYQFSPLKNICLSSCRTPLGYIMTHWREGRSGALLMGLHHGLYCIGCCWALMTILFVVGVMNLAWMAVLSLFMFIEKASARGLVVGKGGGYLAHRSRSGDGGSLYSVIERPQTA
ncbi:MAG: hypothetical protein C4309_14275 [Chloroflexota bacterium]